MTLGIATVGAMYAAFTAVGWLASRKVRQGTAADLILAGRQMPLWIAALTMTATWVDGGYLLGTTEATYKSSVQLGIQGGLCFGVSLIVGGLIFADIMRRFGFTTLIDPFEARLRQTVGGGARAARARRRIVLECGTAGGDRLDLRRVARHEPDQRHPSVCGRHHRVHRARRHVVGRLH